MFTSRSNKIKNLAIKKIYNQQKIKTKNTKKAHKIINIETNQESSAAPCNFYQYNRPSEARIRTEIERKIINKATAFIEILKNKNKFKLNKNSPSTSNTTLDISTNNENNFFLSTCQVIS